MTLRVAVNLVGYDAANIGNHESITESKNSFVTTTI
ncbi:hypothetical protein PH30N_04440 [Cutibacterium modestum 30N]|nr:hypothetical protein [Cutibacterium modestum 28N]MCP2377642.1 hypothetical protein [Cutibacterium modestum 31N]MCP2380280.1 hypothetical protein [Cutibacterium modestum 30N]